MKKVGNIASNKIYNPDNKKPAIPVDADEADSAMERYIRSKYMNQGFIAATRRHHTGSTESDETPPPLPPKTPAKFSFRGASSTFPLFSRSKKDVASRTSHSNPRMTPRSPEYGHRPKISQVFGASLGYDSEDDVQKKLTKLRELGYSDDRKNEAILKGVNGNLERTIESLVRLEGRSLASMTPRDEFPVIRRPPASAGNPTTAGLSVSRAETARPMSATTNPFDISPAQPISTQSTGNMGNRNPFFNNSTNPFGLTTAQSNDALNQAFSSASLGASQPLFPHHTGGVPTQQPQQQVIYQQGITSPVPAIPQIYAAAAFNDNQIYSQQPQQLALEPAQPLQPTHTGYNPFLNNIQPPQPQQQPFQQLTSLNTGLTPTPTGGAYANNPFHRSPTRITSPTPLGQIPEQSQQNFYSQPVQQPPQVNNPFYTQPAAAAPMPQQHFDQFGQPMVQQVPQRADKASILALYNMPQLAPQPAHNSFNAGPHQGQQPAQQQGQASINQVLQPPNLNGHAMEAAPATMAGNNNPFYNGSGAPQPTAAQASGMDGMVGNRSRDSMMALGMEWSNGRHSPDAFASLSARSR